ncbi:putative Pyruvate carboxylase [Paratrimastix pyriformis]|uniref:acetyl-CoA carboxytransferase n=1 Tax=Paratrimastix pyriformis TaxID=342808 RepID=A0ABQ8UHD7_9EUKA|nr:putative Pyruvate carboxylase [Paratrimastix pyriformis]
MATSTPLFGNIASKDFLHFQFAGDYYREQLDRNRMKTGKLCAIDVSLRKLSNVRPQTFRCPHFAFIPFSSFLEQQGCDVVWMLHDFSIFGGSLGCAEGHKLYLGFEYATEHHLPVVVENRSGGARMQEGTMSLAQMAKVSCAVHMHHATHLPYISVLQEPTYGGVSASYAMQGDIRIGIKNARIGFAGPQVILNTIFNQKQAAYDKACPAGFQTAPFVQDHGQLDIVVPTEGDVLPLVEKILMVVCPPVPASGPFTIPAPVPFPTTFPAPSPSPSPLPEASPAPSETSAATPAATPAAASPVPPHADSPAAIIAAQRRDFRHARRLDRYQAQDIIGRLFPSYVDLRGDGRIGTDACIHGGLATFQGHPVMVIGTFKGHTEDDFAATGYGMATPHGYRLAHRLMRLAERLQIPVVTLIDTPGAEPSFEAERDGQSEAISSNLELMAGLKVPIVSIVIGEGGSGGALGLAMGNRVGMCENAYYAVITPEGCASILGRYKDDAHKAKQFMQDALALCEQQHEYAHQLKSLGMIDSIIAEACDPATGVPMESYRQFAYCAQGIEAFVAGSLNELRGLSQEQLVGQRCHKFAAIGQWDVFTPEQMEQLAAARRAAGPVPAKSPAKPEKFDSLLVRYLADRVVNAPHAVFKGHVPVVQAAYQPLRAAHEPMPTRPNAKSILDARGPDGLRQWLLENRDARVLVTDTTLRDAHQSLLATRVRTVDMLQCADATSRILHDAFSLEMWGGATFDVAYRFLNEDPWERLRLLRQKGCRMSLRDVLEVIIPNVCFQMLLRGSNAVGYSNYPNNAVRECVLLAARSGIDIFRIFDCFNDLNSMRVSLEAVKDAGKVAEVCICFSGDFLDPNEHIYTLDYYRGLARAIAGMGAHILAIKDMAGLVKPQMAAPLMAALREAAPQLPIHFHTHNTSSAALTTVINMAANGCEIVDLAISAMADLTSQPSLNAFLAAMKGMPRDPAIDYLTVEPLASYWATVRALYEPFEGNMKTGTARVYDNQIPGGQFSNLYAQWKDMRINCTWDEVLDMYRDVNRLFGDVIKVTPSSKCVGDMALYLLSKHMTCEDVFTRPVSYPESVKQLFRGELGFPHHGLPERLKARVLPEGECQSANAALASVDFGAIMADLQRKFPSPPRPFTDLDVISRVMYPKVFDDYMAFVSKFGMAVPWMPTVVFYYGMAVGDRYTVHVPRSELDPETMRALGERPENREGLVEVTFELVRVGPASYEHERTLVIALNGKEHSVKLTVKPKGAASAGVKANPADKSQVASPMAGVVGTVYAQPGQAVKKGEKLLALSAMKMDLQIPSPFDGTVSSINVKAGDTISSGILLAVVTPALPN